MATLHSTLTLIPPVTRLKCIVRVLRLIFWAASMLGHGAGIGYTGPRMGPSDNFSLVTGQG